MQYLAELYTYDVSNREPEKHIRERRRSGCGGQLAKSTLPTVTASAATVPTTAIAATAVPAATSAATTSTAATTVATYKGCQR